MQKFKTHFEQVPLEVVNKIVEAQSGREESPEQIVTPKRDQELLSTPGPMPRSARQEQALSAGQLEFPRWQAPLQELILEFDREKFCEKLPIVETAILMRLRQLGAKNDDYRERLALNDGLSVIGAIARDRDA